MSDLIGRAVRRFASRLRLHHHFQSAEATATRMASLMVVLSLLIPTPTTSASAAALQRLAAGPAGVGDTSEHVGSKAIAAERRDALPPTLADIQPPPDLIFVDGFESGSFSGWSSATTGGGDLSVSAVAALAGAYGMRANINDNTSLYVTDQTPATVPHYRARFYFDPNSIAMASGNAHYLFYAYMGTSTVIERLELRSYQGDYQTRLSYLDDTTTWKNSAWFLLRDQPHLIEMEYLAATADGANNGRVALWLDGVLVSDAAALNNDTRRIDFIRLGPVAGIDTGTRGVYYFDAFESRSESYIGEDPTAPPLPSPTQPADLIFGDGFETASLIAWSASAIDGGDLSVSEPARLVGFAGLQALLDDNNSIYVTDWSPVFDPNYHARFYFDPNSIPMASGNAHYLLDAYMDNGRTSSAVIFRLEFRYYNGAYQVRATGMKDNLQTSSTPWAAITNDIHLLELEWWTAGAPGSNDGGVYLFVDGTRYALSAGLDNDTLRVDSLRLGAVSGIDTGSRGTYYFDAFQSRRFDDIGPVGSVPQQSGASRLLFDDRHPSLFTGQLRSAFPVWTPPGRMGMTPAVTLAYASGVVDGWIGDVQAPWVGAGWNLDGVEVVRRITTSEAGYGYLDQYDLTFNGVSHELIADPSTPGRYHTQEESFLYLQRHSPALGNAGAVANATGEWWEVVARDGTRYRLGWNPDAEQRSFMPGYSCTTGSPCTIPVARYAASGYAGIGVDVVALRWRVDRVLDRHGNFMTYAYMEEPKAVGTATYDRASYLASIRYSGHQDGGGNVDLQPGYEVRFVLASRPGDSPSGGLALWETVDTQLLDRIDVCYGACATGTVVRSYDLEFDILPAVSPAGRLVLTGITASSAGFSENGQTISAATSPAQGFSYELMSNIDPGCGGCQQRAYPRLTQVENGTGGSVTYTWENDNPTPDRPYAWRVAETVTDDGLGVATVSRFSYESPAYPTGSGLLIGYGNASETSYEVNGTTPILTTRQTHGTADPDIGRAVQTEWRDGSGTALRRTAYQWTTDNSGLPAGVIFRYVEQETRFERSGGSLTEIGHTTFTRSAATGNLTQRKDYRGAALHRTIDLTYTVNSDPLVWILDRVATQLLRDSSGNLKGEQRFYYDGSLTAPPTLGDLTLSQARTGEASATADIAYAYDAYGNATEVRAYEAYGTAGTAPSGYFESTTVGYDPAHRTHPISVSNALDHETSIEYLFSLGVPYRITDPNNLSTSAQYDGLGRTRSTTAPGFASPTVKTTYPTPNPQGQVPAPYSVETEVWDTLGPGGAAYRSAWTIYDGLGRTIQSQAEDGGQLFVRDVNFNAQSLVQRQGIARTISGSGGTFQAPTWGGILHVETTYDALGRPIEIEQPDGETIAYDYSGLTTSEIDPNGHKLEREYDALGRQIEVREYSGEDPSFSLYATTTYLYDVADRLTRITDALSHQTNLVYDWLGRKTSMQDPNAGDLSYVYDPLGNLLSQTDAKGCTATLAYDDLNRLSGRTYSGPGACGTTPSVSVSYDATAGGNLGLGRRTGMTDASGSAAWLYTDSGRTVQETRTVSGAPTPYQVTTESDWMGRPDTLTYPDGEQVSYTYDTLGRPDGMGSSAAGSLADLAYTGSGLLSEAALGNGVLLQNCYRSDNLKLESRRAYAGSAQACSVPHPEGAAIDFRYAYDPVGNISSMEDAVRAESFTYSYDFLDRLVEAGGIDLTSFVFREQRTFNEVGVVTQLSEWNGQRAGTGSYEETYSGFWFLGGWSSVAEPGASAGAYLQSGETGARVRLAFTGGGFNYVRPTGPDQGIAEVYLDGQLLADADNYSATPAQQVSTSYPALPAGNHLVEIRVSGRKNAASTGQAIGLDVLAITEGGQQASVGGGHLSAPARAASLQGEPSATPTASATPEPAGTATPFEPPSATPTPTTALGTPTPTGELPTSTPTPTATPTPTDIDAFQLTPTAVPKELLEQGPGIQLEGLDQLGCSDGLCTLEIVSSSDDAGTLPGTCTGQMSASEIYFGQCQNGQDVTSGFRFTGVEIPQGAVIQEARLEFTVDGEYSVDLTLSLHGEASDNAATFHPGGPPLPPAPPFPTLEPDMPADRPLGQASAAWHIPSSEVWVIGHEHSSPDIASVVQEIVDRPGWVSGNALAIIAKNAGTSTPPNLHRRVMAFERGGMQPGWHFARLVVTYSTTPPPGYDPQPVIPDPDHPHAVSEVQRPGGTDTYSYDDTGSLTARTEAGTTYTQTTNAEGRLVRVEKTASGEVWTFAYDGDGNQIKRTNPDATSTLFLAGGLYEVSLDAAGQQTAVRRYYLLAGQRLAMRDASGTSYLLTDHIGSVVAVLDGSGVVVGEQRYKPFGQPRLTPGIGQTDVGFTGQKSLAAAGLQDFNARWLDSSLGMFAAPDSLIANPYNPQSLNPYGYVMNNPLRYTDPTGLYVFEEAPSDKYVSVSDPRVRYASKTPQSKPLAPAPKPATGSPSAPGPTGGVQEGAGAPMPEVRSDCGVLTCGDYWSASVFTNIPSTVISGATALLGLGEPSFAEEPVTIPALLASKWISLGVTVTWDRFGRVYLSPGVALGRNFPYPVSVTLHVGKLDKPAYQGAFGEGVATSEELRRFLGGGPSVTHGLAGPIAPSFARTWVPGSDQAAWEFGFGVPQINLATYNLTSIPLGSFR